MSEAARPDDDALIRAMRDERLRPYDVLVAAISAIGKTSPRPSHKQPLLIELLKFSPIPHVGCEAAVTAERRALLREVIENTVVDEDRGRFALALAQQCFLIEYVYAMSPQEEAAVTVIRARIESDIARGCAPAEMLLGVMGCYAPLFTIANAEKLLQRSLSTEMSELVRQQIEEPFLERQMRRAIPRLTPIDDEVSVLVRDQYEANPYPRWIRPNPIIGGKPIPLNEFARLNYPGFRPMQGADLLIAGCGTGRHAIEIARQIRNCSVLAIDLSLSSLAYAQRKAAELDLPNIRFAQADILNVASLGCSFDLIAAGGVLHHMADPLAGWRTLLSVLKPDGMMSVALYSKLGRRSLDSARQLIAERGYRPAPQDIRACRQELVGRADPSIGWGDFYTMSECRDLLFHVQEHPLELPTIAQFLAEHDLVFLGFDLPAETRATFESRHSGRRTDLESWDAFERENPDTFRNMYRFAVQRAP